jgi:hypothetical protein
VAQPLSEKWVGWLAFSPGAVQNAV